MRKYVFIITLISTILVFTSCENEDGVIKTPVNEQLAIEQLKIRVALESTTNTLLDMLAKDQKYYNEINKLIIAGSPEYLEDRVMFKDLFSNVSKSTALRVKANTNQFTSDFKSAFTNNKPKKVGGVNGVNSSLFSNPDSLIQFLVDNNFSLYCPYPLEDYAENNRIPTITFHPLDNDSINTGYLLHITGSLSTVEVTQEYADKNPVWIIMPNEKMKTTKMNSKSNTKTTGYEVMVKKIYCKEYFGGIFDGDLNMHILRLNANNVVYDASTNTYGGGILTDLSFDFPRKYVRYAKEGWLCGWYDVSLMWDSNWETSKNSNIMLIYEWDKKGTQENTVNLNTYDENGKAVANLGTLKNTTKSQDATIGLSEWSRVWFFDIINNGNPNWYFTNSGNTYYKWEGDNIIKMSNAFLMTMRVREY